MNKWLETTTVRTLLRFRPYWCISVPFPIFSKQKQKQTKKQKQKQNKTTKKPKQTNKKNNNFFNASLVLISNGYLCSFFSPFHLSPSSGATCPNTISQNEVTPGEVTSWYRCIIDDFNFHLSVKNEEIITAWRDYNCLCVLLT